MALKIRGTISAELCLRQDDVAAFKEVLTQLKPRSNSWRSNGTHCSSKSDAVPRVQALGSGQTPTRSYNVTFAPRPAKIVRGRHHPRLCFDGGAPSMACPVGAKPNTRTTGLMKAPRR